MAKQGERTRKDQEKAAEHGSNKPSAVEGKGKVRGPEDMDHPGAGPRHRSD